MKTTKEILDSISKDTKYMNFSHVRLCLRNNEEYADSDLCEIVSRAMIAYAFQVREEDRKIIAKNVKMTGIAYGNDTSVTDYEVDINSIFNAPKIELK